MRERTRRGRPSFILTPNERKNNNTKSLTVITIYIMRHTCQKEVALTFF